MNVKWLVIGLLLLGVGLLVGSMMVRVSSKGMYEVKTIDLVLIVIPLLVYGLASGKLQNLDMFGVKADFSQLWATAVETQIEYQVSTLPVAPLDDLIETIAPGPKVGVNEIPRLIEAGTEALSFRLQMGGYYGPAIQSYFDQLFSQSNLRFVVINNPDGTLFGVYVSADIIGYLRSLGDEGYVDFARNINAGDDAAKNWLTGLPGFVSISSAVTAATSKRTALQEMQSLDLVSLPVIDSDNRYVGVVDSTRITASLILEVTENIQQD